MDVHRVQDDLLERLARREALPSRDVAIVVAHPDDEASIAFRSIAERVDIELAPKRRYRTELKIV